MRPGVSRHDVPGRRPGRRPVVEVIDDTLDVPDEVIDRDVGDPQVEPAIFGQGLGVFALVVLLTDREPAVERHHSRLAAVRRERGHDARVESAAEIGADGTSARRWTRTESSIRACSSSSK